MILIGLVDNWGCRLRRGCSIAGLKQIKQGAVVGVHHGHHICRVARFEDYFGVYIEESGEIWFWKEEQFKQGFSYFSRCTLNHRRQENSPNKFLNNNN